MVTAIVVGIEVRGIVMICVAVTYVIQSGHEDEAVALFAKLTEHTEPNRDAGCTCASVDERSRRFFLYEQYDDQAASTPIAPCPISSSMPRGDFPIIESRAPRSTYC